MCHTTRAKTKLSYSSRDLSPGERENVDFVRVLLYAITISRHTSVAIYYYVPCCRRNCKCPAQTIRFPTVFRAQWLLTTSEIHRGKMELERHHCNLWGIYDFNKMMHMTPYMLQDTNKINSMIEYKIMYDNAFRFSTSFFVVRWLQSCSKPGSAK